MTGRQVRSMLRRAVACSGLAAVLAGGVAASSGPDLFSVSDIGASPEVGFAVSDIGPVQSPTTTTSPIDRYASPTAGFTVADIGPISLTHDHDQPNR